MKAAILSGLKSINVEDVDKPDVVPGSILLKVSNCAVCGSDIRIFNSGNERVEYPAIIGHEMAGEIVEIGEGVNKFSVGESVSIGADVPCGKCYWCQNGMGNCCDINYAVGYQFQGGFAEYCLLNPTIVNYGPVTKIPDGTPLDLAALAEPLACCINGLERVFFSAGKSVLVIGAGPIGIMLIKAAESFGASQTILADVDSKRLGMAEKFGADFLVNSSEENLVSFVDKVTGGRGVNAVFTACPSADAHETAVQVVAKRGFVNLFGGLPKDARNISISSNMIHYRESYLTGSHGSTPVQHQMALNLISNGRIDLNGLITHKFKLEEIEKAFDTVKNREGLKVLVNPQQE